MLKRLALTSLLAVSSMQAGFLDNMMEVVSSPEVQKAAADTVSGSQLVSDVSKETNLDLKQASSAVANLLQYSQSNMTADEQKQVTNSYPAWTQLASTGAMTAINSSEALRNSFTAMGIDPSLIQTMIPIVVRFFQSQSNESTANIISNSLSSLLK